MNQKARRRTKRLTNLRRPNGWEAQSEIAFRDRPASTRTYVGNGKIFNRLAGASDSRRQVFQNLDLCYVKVYFSDS